MLDFIARLAHHVRVAGLPAESNLPAMTFTLTLEGTAAKSFERITRNRSRADVLREALVLVDIWQEVLDTGAMLIIRSKDGTEREIVRL